MIIDTDKYLIEGIRSGDESAFARIFSTYYPVMCEYASMYVSDKNAEDIVQDIMVWLWNTRSDLNINTSLRSYLLTAVKNRCIDIIRSDKTKRKIQEFVYNKLRKEFESPDSILLSDMSEQIHLAVENLPENYRKVFEMSRFDYMSNKEIADHLGVSVKNVEYLITQSLKILRLKLKDYLYTILL